jgi:hypothetical protein
VRKKRSTGITASDLAAQLATDPEYQRHKARADAELAERAQGWQEAEAPLVEALRLLGYSVDSVWNLVNTEEPYPDALPVLIDHLQREYPDRVREGIARALAVPAAAFGWPVLSSQYRAEREPDAKNGLAAALAATVTPQTISELVVLAEDPCNGDSRLLLLLGLARVATPEARVALEGLSDDAALGQEARRLLRS